MNHRSDSVGRGDVASRAARQAALVVDRSSLGTIVVTGPDRISWLNAIVTCDLGRVGHGTAVSGLLLTKQGKIVTDLTVVAGVDRLFVSVQPGRGVAVLEELDRMLIMEDAELEHASDAQSWLSLHGPQAVSLAAALAESVGGAAGGVDWTGLGGAAVVVPKERFEEARQVLDRPGVVHATDEQWLALRLERGLPEMGVDFTTDDNPHQAALDRRAVSWNKGCYLGQEVVCLLDMRGKVRRRLASIVLSEEIAPPPQTPVFVVDRDEPVGTVTSSTVSPRLGCGVALARLLTKHSEPGTPVLIAGTTGMVTDVPDE